MILDKFPDTCMCQSFLRVVERVKRDNIYIANSPLPGIRITFIVVIISYYKKSRLGVRMTSEYSVYVCVQRDIILILQECFGD